MKTELELGFKKETGNKPALKDLFCPDCGEFINGSQYYTIEFVEFLISKIENYENNQRGTKGN